MENIIDSRPHRYLQIVAGEYLRRLIQSQVSVAILFIHHLFKLVDVEPGHPGIRINDRNHNCVRVDHIFLEHGLQFLCAPGHIGSLSFLLVGPD